MGCAVVVVENHRSQRAVEKDERICITKSLLIGENLKVYKKSIGFGNFTPYMEKRIHSMFAQSIGPVLRRCKELLANYEERQTDLAI